MAAKKKAAKKAAKKTTKKKAAKNQVYLGQVAPESVRVELFADARDDLPAERHRMQQVAPLAGAVGGFVYRLRLATHRPAAHYTPRIVPYHAEAQVPQEAEPIRWYPL